MTEEKTPFDEDIEFSEEEGGSVGEERLFPVPEGTRRVRLDVFLSSVAELSRSRNHARKYGKCGLSPEREAFPGGIEKRTVSRKLTVLFILRRLRKADRPSSQNQDASS